MFDRFPVWNWRILKPVFHRNSYGYRPGKSAHDALVKVRQRCWAHDWVLDLDIKSFFDEIDWDLLMRVVRRTRTAHGFCSTSNGGCGRP